MPKFINQNVSFIFDTNIHKHIHFGCPCLLFGTLILSHVVCQPKILLLNYIGGQKERYYIFALKLCILCSFESFFLFFLNFKNVYW